MAIPWYYRFYFYGIHGFFDEILFTSLHDFFLLEKDYRLKGQSSLHVFYMYGLASLQVEHLYLNYLKCKYGLLTRCIVYCLYGFSWEFLIGLILSCFSACPWDYSDHKYNLMGLITLEYGPLWVLCCLVQELFSDTLAKFCVKESTQETYESKRD